jgi:hypothetical protein
VDPVPDSLRKSNPGPLDLYPENLTTRQQGTKHTLWPHQFCCKWYGCLNKAAASSFSPLLTLFFSIFFLSLNYHNHRLYLLLQIVVHFYNNNEDYHLKFTRGQTVTYDSNSDNIYVCNVCAASRTEEGEIWSEDELFPLQCQVQLVYKPCHRTGWLTGNCWHSTSIRPRSFPSKSFPLHRLCLPAILCHMVSVLKASIISLWSNKTHNQWWN